MDDFAEATPARFALLLFAALVTVFTALLSLPVSATNGRITPFVDALFTAVSVVCVTGLSTVDMATHWSPFGHAVIFVGVQVGAVGVLTVASILGLVIARRIGLRQRLLAASDGNPMRAQRGPVSESQAVRLGEIGGLLTTVAVSMLAIEASVAVLLFHRALLESANALDAIWVSTYFAVMSFTNTGFVLSPGGLDPFISDPWFLTVVMASVFLGAIGFPVIYAFWRTVRRPRIVRRRRRLNHHWSLHVKLTLTTTNVLFIAGAIAFFGLEFRNAETFGGMDTGQRILQASFLSMMTRSGGFSTFDISHLDGSSLMVADMLMFIGGGSASTAGGIKVTTLAVLFLAAFAEARGNRSIEAFDRRIPSDVLRVSVSIVLWGATIVAGATIAILQVTDAPLDFVLFDVISAFATSGLSTGVAASAPESAQLVLALTMFLGRVGTVTPAVDESAALVQKWSERVAHAVQADARNIDALRQIGAQELSIAIVAVGSSIEASVLITANLVDLGIPQIWAKAISQSHGKILSRIGANHVIYPEAETGERIAHLVSGRMLDFIEFDDDFAVVKMYPPKPIRGISLGESGVRRKFGVTVVGVKSPGNDFTHATAETVISNHDLIVVSGKSLDIERFATATG